MSSRVKFTEYTLSDFIILLGEKKWLTQEHKSIISQYTIKEDEYGDDGYAKIIYFIFFVDEKNVYHLVFKNSKYYKFLKECNGYSCGGGLYTSFISTISDNPKINQLDFTREGNYPDIPPKTEESTINFKK